MVFIGVVAAYSVAIGRMEKYGVAFSHFLVLCASALAGTLIGSKLLDFLTVLHVVIDNFTFSKMLLAFINGGFVFYGGLFGAIFGLAVTTRILRKDVKPIFNLFVLSFPAFHFFGRIGCFFAGCCYGIELETPIELFHAVHIDRVPTQLFEAMFEFALFFVLLIVCKKRKSRNLLKIYLLAYAVFRFANEFFRGDEIRNYHEITSLFAGEIM